MATKLSIPSRKFGILEQLNLLKEEKFKFDCILKGHTKNFECHKIVVASASPILKAMLLNENEAVSQIETNVSDRAVDLFLQYAYQAQLIVQSDNDLEVINN